MKTIFLSHSTKDKKLAEAIFKLLNRFIRENNLGFEYKVFYSPKSLKEEDDNRADWRAALPNAIEKSSTIIVLWTPNSMNNRWVNYEIGIATAMKKNIVAVGVKGLNYDNIIPNQVQVLCLEDKYDIKLMLKHTFKYPEEDQTMEDWVSSANVDYAIEGIVREARRKCIYFVGSRKKSGNHLWRRRLKSLLKNYQKNSLNEVLNWLHTQELNMSV